MKSAKKRFSNPDHVAFVSYGALALLILGPMLLPGYILTLDMVFMPKLNAALSLDNLLPYRAAMNALNLVLPGQIIQKLILLAIFALAGLGMHRLVPGKNEWAKYAAGMLYVINPFTYSRLMAGQYLVLAGYAMMPWFVGALLKFIREPGKGSALRLGLWTAGIGFVSLHYLGFAVLVALVAGAIALVRVRRDGAHMKRLLVWSAAIVAGLLLVNSFWLVPALTGHSSQSQLIGNFDKRHALSFRTASDPQIGQLGNTIGLYGMWTDREGLYRLSKGPVWRGLMIVIWAIAVVGVVKYRRRYRLEIVLLGTVMVVALVLAQGIMGSPFAGLNGWLFDHVPFYRGYREPGKFIGLVALGLAYFFGLGVAWILERTRGKKWGEYLPPLLMALPLLYTPTMLWGAGGQLRAVDYPADWYSLNRTLNAETGEGKVLFLPWHQYMYFQFAGRLIANPASRFFDRPVIQGDNAEIGLIERQSSNPTSSFIEDDILAPDRTDVAARLRSRGIKYVVLAKEADYKKYAWLDSQPGIRLVSDSATLRVYALK
jgi:hypothetical protein